MTNKNGTFRGILNNGKLMVECGVDYFGVRVDLREIVLKGYSSFPNSRLRASISDAGGARGVMVIVVGNGDDDTSSNPGRDWLHFT